MISSLIAGGITGLIGTAVQSVANYKGKKLELEIENARATTEVAIKNAEAKIMAQEWAARTQVAAVEAGAKEAAADAEAFAASFNEPKRYAEGLRLSPLQAWAMVALDFVRGMVRPGLTLYLCILTTLIYVQARSMVQGDGQRTKAVIHYQGLLLMQVLPGQLMQQVFIRGIPGAQKFAFACRVTMQFKLTDRRDQTSFRHELGE